jgi:hypothetical protein
MRMSFDMWCLLRRRRIAAPIVRLPACAAGRSARRRAAYAALPSASGLLTAGRISAVVELRLDVDAGVAQLAVLRLTVDLADEEDPAARRGDGACAASAPGA